MYTVLPGICIGSGCLCDQFDADTFEVCVCVCVCLCACVCVKAPGIAPC